MNAQTVVDTFAPFVGTEGLRDVSAVRPFNNSVEIDLEWEDGKGYPVLVDHYIAHGFLLSRLAEGLAERTWTIHLTEDDRWIADNNYGDGVADIGDSPDYLSAILAAARMEWPKRELEPVAVGGAEKRVLETLLAIRDDFDRRIKALGLDQTHPMMRADSD